jgi:hypothetical protein
LAGRIGIGVGFEAVMQRAEWAQEGHLSGGLAAVEDRMDVDGDPRII